MFAALALKYMREMNVSHLDLKPQNILLSSTHNPVLKIGGVYILKTRGVYILKIGVYQSHNILYIFQNSFLC